MEDKINSVNLENRDNKILFNIIYDKVVLPGLVTQISFDKNDQVLNTLKKFHKNHDTIGFIQAINPSKKISKENLYKHGTLAHILDIVLRRDDKIHVLLKGLSKIKIDTITKKEKLPGNFYSASYNDIDEDFNKEISEKDLILTQSLKESVIQLLKYETESINDLEDLIQNLEDVTFLVYFAISICSASSKTRQKLLDENSLSKKLKSVLKIVLKELNIYQIKKTIKSKIHKGISDQQKEFFLRQEIKALQNELGEDESSEFDKLLLKAQKKKLPSDVLIYLKKTIKKAERVPLHSSEYPNYINYLEYIVDLPWNKHTTDNYDINNAQKILDKNHYGMSKIKERILEYIAVMNLRKEQKGSILCLVGPPGVGKTSLIKSIAKALNRKYARISLGATSDEADIKGHRRTYVAAMPGKIIECINQSKSSNPVINLDEIDKINNSRADISASLLEVLDYEQNDQFKDNYLEIPYDLSKVIFIATANDISNIPGPLRDRIEFIEITGYSTEEKIEIAQKYIIPQQLKEHGLTAKNFSLKKNIIEEMIENYTFESGVRDLKRKIAQINRKIAKQKSLDPNLKKIEIKKDDLHKYLGLSNHDFEKKPVISENGVAIGLAYTTSGGKILYIESIKSKGKGKITISGQLGDVMKESAMAAFSYLKSKASDYNLNYELFNEYDIHIHVPDGATPKDGPSAGITLMTALLSLFNQKKVRDDITMTGEITITGKVLPVGGIKEKVLAAKRSGIKEIILSQANKYDVNEIPKKYISDLKFHFIKNASELQSLAFKKKYKQNCI